MLWRYTGVYCLGKKQGKRIERTRGEENRKIEQGRWNKGDETRKMEPGRGTKEEGRRNNEQGRRDKEQGRRDKEQGTRRMEQGRWNKEESRDLKFAADCLGRSSGLSKLSRSFPLFSTSAPPLLYQLPLGKTKLAKHIETHLDTVKLLLSYIGREKAGKREMKETVKDYTP